MLTFLKGIMVGLGAIAPGLSGSVLLVIFKLYQKTIEVINTSIKAALGLVKDFIKNIKSLKNLKNSQNLKVLIENIKFIVPLFLGIGLGAILFSKLVDFLMANFEMQTRFAFLGLILGTVPLLLKEVKKEGFRKFYILPMVIAAGVGIFLFFFNKDLFPDIENPNFLQSIVLGIAVATSYIVPGVDSAAILSALGLYNIWITSIANITSSLHILIPAGVGLVAGVLLVSFIINRLLKKHYTLTFSIIFGLFITVIPSVLNESCVVGNNPKTYVSFVLLVLGFIASLLFSNLEKLKDNQEQ
ncbi:MAG: DUF368 domain-containing protein [Acutalibacteraceae bacterium]